LGMTPYAPSITLSFRMQATRQGLIRTNVEWQQCCCRNAISDLKDQKTVGQIRALPKGAPAIAIADRERRHALVPILKKWRLYSLARPAQGPGAIGEIPGSDQANPDFLHGSDCVG